jgi:hypothetical protein
MDLFLVRVFVDKQRLLPRAMVDDLDDHSLEPYTSERFAPCLEAYAAHELVTASEGNESPPDAIEVSVIQHLIPVDVPFERQAPLIPLDERK